jgi:hypothetical protein
LFTLGEGIFSGFFEDDTPKKPVPSPAVVPAVIPEAPVVVPAPVVPVVVPAKVEVLSNELIPVIVMTEAPMAVVPIEAVAPTDEKVAEQTEELEVAATMPEKVETVKPVEYIFEIIPNGSEGEALEQAASEIVAAEIPVAVTQTAAVETPATPVAAIATTPVKATSAEEEGLIEGIVNTLIDDGTDGKF